jgi:Holliday junction DNA helicase RuvA
MIGKLTGKIDSIFADHVIIDVGGVGYLVHCPTAALLRLSTGINATLFIETKMSEDAIRLYGFLSSSERDWFRLLQTVQGVGARVALSVLSGHKISELERAIGLGDKAVVGRAQGVGPKLALRIVTELKDRAPAALMRAGETFEGVSAHAPRPVESDAIAALVNLGYSQLVAAESVMRAGASLGDVPLDALIRESLRQMAR